MATAQRARQKDSNYNNRTGGRPGFSCHESTRVARPLFCFLALVTTLAHSADDVGGLEQIVVTAQRREQVLQDVGISLQAFSAKQLEERNIQSSSDIAAFTPGLSLGGSVGGQQTLFTIRGVTQVDFNDIVESPNATYLDDGYLAIAQAQSFALLDIERVEVQKGPQGTLFGRNATGGLIQYITKKPSFSGAEGYADVGIGMYDGSNHAMKKTGEVAFGGPMTETLAGRLAFKYLDQGSYLKNTYPFGALGGPPGPGAGSDTGAARTYAGRISLLYEAADDFTILLQANGAKSDLSTAPNEMKPTIGQLDPTGQFLVNAFDVGPNETRASIGPNGADGGGDPGNTGVFIPIGSRPVPGGDFFGYRPTGRKWETSSDYAFEKPNSVETYGLGVTVKTLLPNDVDLTAVTDYKKYDKLLFLDVDGGPANLINAYAGSDAYSFTQEFRLNGNRNNINWVAGVYYLHIDSDADSGLKFAPGSITPGAPFDLGSEAHLKTDSYSLFAQFDWNFAPKLNLILGGRAIREEKEYDFFQGVWNTVDPLKAQVGTPIVIGPVFGAGGPEAYSDKRGQDLWAAKAQVEYRPVDDVLIYAGINRGVKAGSYNAQLAGGLPVSPDLIPYKAEVLLSKEIGFKSTLLNHTLRLNAAAFHYDYKDYQSFLFTGVSGVVVNNDGETYGAEGSIEASPLDGLDIILGASYIHARVLDVPLLLSTPNIPVAIPTRDVEPTYAPPFQASGLIQYGYDLQGGRLSGRFTATYSDSYFYNLRNFDADRFSSYWKLGLGVDWTTADEHWKAGLDVQNLTNKRIGSDGADAATLCGCNNVSYQPPRLVSLSLRYTY